jgi:hypothetical protein
MVYRAWQTRGTVHPRTTFARGGRGLPVNHHRTHNFQDPSRRKSTDLKLSKKGLPDPPIARHSSAYYTKEEGWEA